MENYIFQADKCPLTGIEKPRLKVLEMGVDQDFGKKGHQWFYPYNDQFLLLVEDELFNYRPFWDINRISIFYLIENGFWPKGKMIGKPLLEALISSSGVPVSPFDKMKEILSYISENQTHFSARFSLDRNNYDFIVRKTGLINSDELEGIVREAGNYNLLDIKIDNHGGMIVILSLKGWELANERSQDKQSNSVFVAMAFSDDMKDVFNEWIRPAIEECGFKAKIVSEEYLKGDQTVNDAILAGIKKAKFTIADFTHHRNGVYFEAGYALGQGQNVIYCCREDEINDAHFDTRNYQHIVWKDGADLKKKLMDKIEVFIKA